MTRPSKACRGDRSNPSPQHERSRELPGAPRQGARQGADPPGAGLHESRARLCRGAPGDKIMLRELRRPTSPSFRRTTTCCRRTSRSSASPRSSSEAAREAGGTAQFAGGVPAMCDGVTQGEPGMELSLFSRDVIALATAVSLSHNMFDAALCLGICDKIVPGLVIGALQFSHLPTIFVPGGPMPSGLSNDEKARVRQRFAKGEVGHDAAARLRGQVVSQPWHLHLLRHREQQPDADGGDGAAPAGRCVRQPEHAAARCTDGARRRDARSRSAPRRRVHADRAGRRRARGGQRHRRPARHRRLGRPPTYESNTEGFLQSTAHCRAPRRRST